MSRQPLTDDQRHARRETILDAAMAVFEDAGGLDALSFRKIAAEAGCSYATPYSYFASKAVLVDALRARAFAWIGEVMTAAVAGQASPDAQLDALARAYIDAALDRPNRYALMFFALQPDDAQPVSLELKAAKRDALDVCTQVIAAGHAAGDFPDVIDALTAAHLFWAAAHGVVSLQVAGQFVMGRDVDTLVPVLIRTLRAGLEHPELDLPQVPTAANE